MRKQQNIHPAIELAYYVPQAILGGMELRRRLTGKPRRKRKRKATPPVPNPRRALSMAEFKQSERESQSLNNHLQELFGSGFDSVFVRRNHPYHVIAVQHPGDFDVRRARGGVLIALKGSPFQTAKNPAPDEWNDDWDADLEAAAKEGDKWLRGELGRGKIKPWRVSWYAPLSQQTVYLPRPVKAHTQSEAIKVAKVMVGANDKRMPRKQRPVNFIAEQMPMEQLESAINPSNENNRRVRDLTNKGIHIVPSHKVCRYCGFTFKLAKTNLCAWCSADLTNQKPVTEMYRHNPRKIKKHGSGPYHARKLSKPYSLFPNDPNSTARKWDVLEVWKFNSIKKAAAKIDELKQKGFEADGVSTAGVWDESIENFSQNPTIIGTEHFTSLGAAVRYYKDYGYDRTDVQQKINNGEIQIGKPPYNPQAGERLLTIDGGKRYAIERNPTFQVDATPTLKARHETVNALTHGGAVRKVKRSLGKHKGAYSVKVQRVNPGQSAYSVAASKGYPYIRGEGKLAKNGHTWLSRFTRDAAGTSDGLYVGYDDKKKRWLIEHEDMRGKNPRGLIIADTYDEANRLIAESETSPGKPTLEFVGRTRDGKFKLRRKKPRKSKRNPGAPANINNLAQMFHGTVTGAELDLPVSVHHKHNKHIQRIGRLPYIKMHNRPQGQKHASPKHACNACAIFFPRRTSWVAMNGSKRIILAGDGVHNAGQRLYKMATDDNPRINGGEVNLGRIEVMAYVTPEKHSNSGKTILYYHPHAEETGSVRDMPSLHIDRNGMLYIPERSGNYDIDERGIIN